MSNVRLKELFPDENGAQLLPDTILRIEEQTGALLMEKHRGMSRELAMVLTKLTEARQWAQEYGVKMGVVAVVDKRKLTPTVTTDETDTTRGREEANAA